jgi:hypothetical protein
MKGSVLSAVSDIQWGTLETVLPMHKAGTAVFLERQLQVRLS